MLLPFIDMDNCLENIDLGLFYDPETHFYYRGYDKDKQVPLTREGVLILKDTIELSHIVKERK